LKITNQYNLPRAFVEMATEEYKYKDKRYSVTSLLKGVRETILQRRYHDKITQDVSEMIWMLFGRAAHNILEHQQEGAHELKEERLEIEIGDYTLSGRFDLYCDKEKKVTDYKTCSTWKIIFGDFEDWRQQLLIYAYMLNKIGFVTTKGEVVAILKDHTKSKAKYDSSYPQLPVHVERFDFTRDDFRAVDAWLKQKFEDIALAETLPDDELPLCTLEERFNDGGKWAVMQGKNKRAVRVLDTEEAANDYMTRTGKGTHVVHRPGEDKKCLDGYCMVREFCNYFIGLQRGS